MKGLSRPPFPQRPLVWGSPPKKERAVPGTPGSLAGDGSMSDLWQAITSTSIAFSYSSGSITTAFPSAIRVASFPFSVPVGVISVTLSSSLKNASSDGILAVFVAKDVGSLLSSTQSSYIFVEHLVEAGLAHSMRSGMAFADDIAPRFGSNESMAVYIASAGAGSSANRASGIVTIRSFQET